MDAKNPKHNPKINMDNEVNKKSLPIVILFLFIIFNHTNICFNKITGIGISTGIS